jgi:hypothetical protein
MLTPAGLIGRLLERLRAEDPEHDALRRAARAAVTVPVAAAVARTVAPGTEAPLYTLLGAFWLMVMVDFPGNRQNRAVGYLGLGLNGIILLALGTLVAPIPWLATTLMFVIGVAVTLAGVVSETVSAGQRATLLFVARVHTGRAHRRAPAGLVDRAGDLRSGRALFHSATPPR